MLVVEGKWRTQYLFVSKLLYVEFFSDLISLFQFSCARRLVERECWLLNSKTKSVPTHWFVIFFFTLSLILNMESAKPKSMYAFLIEFEFFSYSNQNIEDTKIRMRDTRIQDHHALQWVSMEKCVFPFHVSAQTQNMKREGGSVHCILKLGCYGFRPKRTSSVLPLSVGLHPPFSI